MEDNFIETTKKETGNNYELVTPPFTHARHHLQRCTTVQPIVTDAPV